MNVYFWLKDVNITKADFGNDRHKHMANTTIFLIGYWFNCNQKDTIKSKDIWLKSASIVEKEGGTPVRIMKVSGVNHLSAKNIIDLWNWSSTVYKLFLLPGGTPEDGDFSIDIFDDNINPYENILSKTKKFNFSSKFDDYYESFKITALSMGKLILIHGFRPLNF